jgi:radical SAM protein with 4Fe4S-binding SPASM domain
MLKKILKHGQLKAWQIYKDQNREEHKLNYLFWECTLGCNFYCKHCGSSAGRKTFEGELNTLEIKSVFKEVAEEFDARKITIAVTGGEPTIRKDIFEVMSYARSLGFHWGMVTNGFLVDQDIVENMKQAGMETVVVSIDGIKNIHDDFRGMSGAYDHAINAVKLLAKAGFLDDLQITTSVGKQSIDYLEEMYQLFRSTGITSWRVMNIDPIGRAEDNDNVLLDKKQLRTLLNFVKEKRKQDKKIEVTYGCAGYLGLDYERDVRKNYFFCPTGINVASILYNGDIFVCPNVPRRPELIQGNVRKDSFVDVWNNKFKIYRDKKRTTCDKCSKCDSWEECLGNSFHLWDFDKNKPKICHLDWINEKD